MYTWEEIQNMSDEEVAAANAKLGRKVIKTFLLYPALAVGAVYLVNKWIESHYLND